jgi:hypothetical protein
MMIDFSHPTTLSGSSFATPLLWRKFLYTQLGPMATNGAYRTANATICNYQQGLAPEPRLHNYQDLTFE